MGLCLSCSSATSCRLDGLADSHSAGRSSALAISTLFTTFVLMPLPRPSICSTQISGVLSTLVVI
jgi:hypothetical protein